MKRISYLMAVLMVLVAVAGCDKSGAPIHRKMAAAAYWYEDRVPGRYFSFCLVMDKADMVPDPNISDALVVTAGFVWLTFLVDSDTPQGSYSLDVREAVARDECKSNEKGYITTGTVTVGDNKITIIGTMDNGRKYRLSYSGPFQQTGRINVLEK